MATLLVVDDDIHFCEMIRETLTSDGHKVLLAGSIKGARSMLSKHLMDVIFIDVLLPDGYGLALLKELSLLPEAPEAIVISDKNDPEGAASAIASGAWDYVQKPAEMAIILLMVQRALQARSRKLNLDGYLEGTGFVGESAAMRLALLQMEDASHSDVPVLITGETGTGKEMLARIVHMKSNRHNGPFVVVDCGAITPTLLESELFGSIRGAFTGAMQARHGLVMLADQGSLFLDEVGELSLDQQKVFLRLLQERSFRPIGSNEERHSDFRVVAATNRNLNEMVATGTFRSDLLFRLQGLVIETPPLRNRGKDVHLMVKFALERTLKKYRMKTKVFATDAWNALVTYTWPGNVRELLHTVEAAVLAARKEPLVVKQHLPIHLRVEVVRAGLEEDARSSSSLPPMAETRWKWDGQDIIGDDELTKHLEPQHDGRQQLLSPAVLAEPVRPATWKEFQECELFALKRSYLLQLMGWSHGDVPLAAKRAGVSRQRLYALLREHNIVRHWPVSGD